MRHITLLLILVLCCMCQELATAPAKSSSERSAFTKCCQKFGILKNSKTDSNNQPGTNGSKSIPNSQSQPTAAVVQITPSSGSVITGTTGTGTSRPYAPSIPINKVNPYGYNPTSHKTPYTYNPTLPGTGAGLSGAKKYEPKLNNGQNTKTSDYGSDFMGATTGATAYVVATHDNPGQVFPYGIAPVDLGSDDAASNVIGFSAPSVDVTSLGGGGGGEVGGGGGGGVDCGCGDAILSCMCSVGSCILDVCNPLNWCNC